MHLRPRSTNPDDPMSFCLLGHRQKVLHCGAQIAGTRPAQQSADDFPDGCQHYRGHYLDGLPILSGKPQPRQLLLGTKS